MSFDIKNVVTKAQVFEAMLSVGNVFVHFDPRPLNVYVPAHLKKQYKCAFQLGLDMPTPIPDLEYTKTHLSGTLSFKGNPRFVHIPWECVYGLGMEDGRGMTWEECIPVEVKEEMAQIAAQAKLQEELAAQSAELSHTDTNVVSIGSARKREGATPATPSKSHTNKPKDRSHLKLV